MDGKKGQNILEYAVLFAIILSSLMIMQIYIRRAYMGRLKEESDSLGQQYLPKHTISLMRSARSIYSISFTGGQTDNSNLPPGMRPGLVPDARTVPDGMSVTYTDSYSDFQREDSVDSFRRSNNNEHKQE